MKIYRIAEIAPEPNANNMTEEEFIDYHKTGGIDEDAYDLYGSIEGLSWVKKESYPIPYSTQSFGNKGIQFFQSGDKLKYGQRDPNSEHGEYLRDSKGALILLNDEQMLEQRLPLYDTAIAAFDNNIAIGLASDEFGTDGIWVVEQYQRLGIGTYLLSEFRKQFKNDRKIGQMTHAGENMVRSYFRSLREFKGE